MRLQLVCHTQLIASFVDEDELFHKFLPFARET
jgi:hypothetical protein